MNVYSEQTHFRNGNLSVFVLDRTQIWSQKLILVWWVSFSSVPREVLDGIQPSFWMVKVPSPILTTPGLEDRVWKTPRCQGWLLWKESANAFWCFYWWFRMQLDNRTMISWKTNTKTTIWSRSQEINPSSWPSLFVRCEVPQMNQPEDKTYFSNTNLIRNAMIL